MKHPLFPVVTVAAVLSVGLSAGAVAGPATQNQAASQNQSDESTQPVKDGWITTKVKAELLATDGVRSGDVSVDTQDGVVTLTGVLPNDVTVKKAIAAAKSVKGVKRVEASGLKAKS